MARYDFRSLSSQDFEELVRDLLQSEWKVTLEAFKAGRDKGVDLRYSPANCGKTIVQCKHYVGSGFAKLLGHLIKSERPKVERLRPARYVVATSVPLNAGEKDEIVEALKPFVINVADVIGAGDIESLLARYPDVERSNFKLWLTSTSVVERVLHNAEICHTEFEVERIRRKLALFVQGDAFPRVMRLLDESRVAVISGAPGIGKTTLAETVLYTHLEQGYEPVVIQADIAEGKKFFRSDAKRIFYFDDFLGQFFLGDRGEYFGRNQDKAVVDFMEMVRISERSRFVLTTREHLLQSARLLSERLAKSSTLDNRCILELRDYTHAHKARILYNHLYFSGLPQPYKDAILADEFYLTIIMHQHFNPRLIEWLSTNLRQREVSAAEYRDYVSKLLASPHEIWMHAFRNQLSDAARTILLSFYTVGEYTDTIDLEPAFWALHRYRAAKYNRPIESGDFQSALKELDGAFLTYQAGQARYFNPSIREFVASIVSDEMETVEDVLGSAIRFKQVASLWQLSQSDAGSKVGRLLSENRRLLLPPLRRLLFGPSIRWEKSARAMTGTIIDTGEENRIEFLIEMAEYAQSIEFLSLAAKVAYRLISHWGDRVPDFGAVRRLLQEIRARNWVMANRGHELYRALLEGMLGEIRCARAWDWVDLLALAAEAHDWTTDYQAKVESEFKNYCDEGVIDDRHNCSTVDDMSSLIDALTDLGRRTGKDFEYDIDLLSGTIAEREADKLEATENDETPGTSFAAPAIVTTDDDIRQMFLTLTLEESDLL